MLTPSQKILLDQVNHRADAVKQTAQDLYFSDCSSMVDFNLVALRRQVSALHSEIMRLEVAINVSP